MASGSKVAVLAALFGNLTIAILKLTAGLAATSAAMLAEAAHSFSDVGNQILLMVGLRRAHGAPTPEHPFGTGKDAYFWPFMVAVLLFGVAGAYSVIEGIEKVRHPHALGDIRLSLAVLAAAFVIEAVTLGVALFQARKGARARGVSTFREWLRENRDATLLTVIVEDSLALLGLPVAAAALVVAHLSGNPVWDGVGSLAIGALLMGFAVFLAWEVRGLLIGQGLAPRDLAKVRRIVRADAAVEEVLAIQSMYLGSEAVMLGVEVDLKDDIGGARAEDIVARIEAALQKELPVLRFVYVEPRHGHGRRRPTGGGQTFSPPSR